MSMESQPMKDSELGRYVCVVHPAPEAGGCLHSPHITITSDGVWVRLPDSLNPGSHVYSSAHRDCYEARQANESASEAAGRRLEAIRASLRAGNISYGELAELQSLAPRIEPGDTELLEAAGVPEFPDR
jgi:hypothetical protein